MAGKFLVKAAEPRTLHAAADALAAGTLTATQLCESLLTRRRQVDADVRAFIHFDEESVMAEASASDARRKTGQPRSRFDGIPIAIKDCISVSGQACTCASKILEGYTAPYDATAVARLKAAGMICFGRTNMDEFAMGSATEHSAFGPTRNPWNTDHVPGGSSGGSAAAVASGQVLAALGSDTGGSIRQPAGFCGVVGLKPTYGRISRYGLVAYASSLDQIGPIANDVRDTAIMLDLMGGHDPLDCTSLPATCAGFEAALAKGDISQLTIGVPKEFFAVDGLAPEVRAAMRAAAAGFEQAGARCVDISLPNTRHVVSTYYVIATAEASSNLARFDGIRYGARHHGRGLNLLDTYLKTRATGLGQEVKRRIILGTYVLSSGYYDAYYLRAQKVRTLIRQDYDRAFEQCDLLLSPVAPTTAFPFGAMSDPLQAYLSDIYTIPVNLAGICAVTVPTGRDSCGLPVAVQLIGAAMSEEKLLQGAHWLEQSALSKK